MPDIEENRCFQSDIQDQAVMHRENTDWLRKVENELEKLTVEEDIHIQMKKVKMQVRKKFFGKVVNVKPFLMHQ